MDGFFGRATAVANALRLHFSSIHACREMNACCWKSRRRKSNDIPGGSIRPPPHIVSRRSMIQIIDPRTG